MKVYDLTFNDGKRCRMIDMDGDGLRPSNFQPEYLVGMERVLPPIPDRLPWRRDGAIWRLGSFELSKLDGGAFLLKWPSGQMSGGKDQVREAVVAHWAAGI